MVLSRIVSHIDRHHRGDAGLPGQFDGICVELSGVFKEEISRPVSSLARIAVCNWAVACATRSFP